MATAQKRDKMKKIVAVDPNIRRTLFAAAYADTESETFSNAYRSALKAGYGDEYAQSITQQKWFKELSESIGYNMIAAADRNLARTLALPEQVQAMGAFGPIFEKIQTKVKVKDKNGKTKTKIKTVNGKPVMVYSGTLLKYRLDASKFVSERLNRGRYGKDPDTTVVPIQVNINSDREAFA